MTYDESPVKLSLVPELRQKVERGLCQMIDAAVDAADARDQITARHDRMFRMQDMDADAGAKSDLVDPVAFESFETLLSQMSQAYQRENFCQTDAVDPNAEEAARGQELLLNAKLNEYEYPKALYGWAYNAIRHKAGILYVGWCEETQPQYVTKFRDELGTEVEENGKLPGVEYEEVPYEEAVVTKRGLDFRVPHLSDFFVYPPEAQDIQKATGVCERMLFTADELYAGIRNLGYSEKAVQALVAMGATIDHKGRRASVPENYRLADFSGWLLDFEPQDGDADHFLPANFGQEHSSRIDPQDGMYECFLWYGRLPKLWENGLPGLPDYLLEKDVCAVVCPTWQIVLKLEFSPLSRRPYFPASIFPEPGCLYGMSLGDWLEQLQQVMTENIRSHSENLAYESKPTLVAPEEWLEDYGNWEVGAGRILPEKVMGSLRPLVWARSSRDNLEAQTYYQSRAQGVVSASGYGSVQPKVRKNAEIQNVLSAVDAKFGLILANFHQSHPEMYAWCMELLLGHMDEAVTLRAGSQVLELTADQLQGQFRYIPTATASSSSPEQRLQRDMAAKQVQNEYFAASQASTPDRWRLLWHSARSVLLNMEIRDPENWLGAEPAEFESMSDILQREMAAQQAAQQGMMGGMGLPAGNVPINLPPPVGSMNGQYA